MHQCCNSYSVCIMQLKLQYSNLENYPIGNAVTHHNQNHTIQLIALYGCNIKIIENHPVGNCSVSVTHPGLHET